MNEQADKSSWFVSAGNENHGPMTLQDLRTGFEQRRISHTAHVWRDGMQQWIPIQQLLSQSAAPPPHAPLPPATQLDNRPTITIVAIGILSLMNIIWGTMIVIGFMTGSITKGPAGELYTHFPSLLPLHLFSAFITFALSIVLMIGAVLALLKNNAARRLLKITVAANFPILTFFPIAQAVIMVNSDTWQRIPEANRTFLISNTSLTLVLSLAVFGFILWRLTRKPW